MKTKKYNLQKCQILFNSNDDDFIAVVRIKKKLGNDASFMPSFMEVYENVLTKALYTSQYEFISKPYYKDGYYTDTIDKFIDENIAIKIENNKTDAADIIKIINNAKLYRKQKET